MENSINEDLKILQACELENLTILKQVCDENNLRYYLIGGTLIGVVRHKGFIPWDDDIDVGLPRPDYNKFLDLIGEYLPDFMDVKTMSSDPNYKCYFTRLINNKKKIYWNQGHYNAKIGIWMDVFPIDGLPNNKLLRYLQVFRVYWIKMLYKFTQIEHVTSNKKSSKFESFLIQFAKVTKIGKILSADKLLHKLDKQLQRYNYDECDFAWNFSGGHALKEIMPKRLWGGHRVERFEGMEVSVPECAEEHLEYIFGDYMTPPPENERITHSIEFVNE